MSLLFNMLSRLIIAFLPRSKHLLTSWLQSPSAVILEPRNMKFVIVLQLVVAIAITIRPIKSEVPLFLKVKSLFLQIFQRFSEQCNIPCNCGVGEDSWESLDCKVIQPVHSEGDQPWDFFGRNDAKAEAPVLWPPHVKSWLIGKDSDAGRDWGQEEKGTTEDEMAGWHHRLDGCKSEWTPGVGDGRGGLVCCNSWGCKESDTTERLNWNELNTL